MPKTVEDKEETEEKEEKEEDEVAVEVVMQSESAHTLSVGASVTKFF